MTEDERYLRNEDEPGRTFEAERAARNEESPEVEGHKFYNPAEDRFLDAEDETKRTF